MADPIPEVPAGMHEGAFLELAEAAGWMHAGRLAGHINYAAMARGLPYDESTVYLIMGGQRPPTAAFKIAVLRAARKTFPGRPAQEPDYFLVEEESNSHGT